MHTIGWYSGRRKGRREEEKPVKASEERERGGKRSPIKQRGWFALFPPPTLSGRLFSRERGRFRITLRLLYECWREERRGEEGKVNRDCKVCKFNIHQLTTEETN